MIKTISNRFDGIQVLRIIAALLVVITHATFYASERLTNSNISVWGFGTIGVDIFFIIISIPIALIVASIIHMMIERPAMRFIKNSIFKK